jgi:hypothetical protein
MMLIRFKLLTFALFFISYCWLGAVRKGLPPNDGGAIRRLPEALEVKTLSLNPEYCVFGLPAKGGGGKLPMLIYLHSARGVGSGITKAGGKQAKVIVLPDMGHNAGKVPHGDPDFYKWLYGNKRQRK